MTADLPTHPSTEAVGEVRREQLAVRLECIETTLNDDGTARLQRGELIAGGGRFLGEVLCTPDEYVSLHAALTAAEKLRSDLSAMTSDRDWLRSEFEKASAEIAELRSRLSAYEFALTAEQATMHAVVKEAQKLAVAKWVRQPSAETVELTQED